MSVCIYVCIYIYIYKCMCVGKLYINTMLQFNYCNFYPSFAKEKEAVLQ